MQRPEKKPGPLQTQKVPDTLLSSLFLIICNFPLSGNTGKTLSAFEADHRDPAGKSGITDFDPSELCPAEGTEYFQKRHGGSFP